MTYHSLYNLLPPLFSGFISLGLAYHIWQRRTMIGAGKFAIIMMGTAIWSFAHTLKIAAASTTFMVIFDNIAYLGMDIVAIGIVTFALAFTQNRASLNWQFWALLCIEPIANLVMIWSDPLHGLFRNNLESLSNGVFKLILYEPGVWGVVVLAYFYAVVLFSLLILVQFYLQSNQLNRNQTGIIILGISFPYLVGIFSMLGFFNVPDRDIFPLTFSFSNILLAWGMLRFRIFDIVPVSRESILESMHEGMIFLDQNERILDVNPAALDIIGLEEKDLLGRSIKRFINTTDQSLVGKEEKILVESQIKNEKTGAVNTYNVQLSPLLDKKGKLYGRMIFLQDITRRKILEAELHHMATTDPLTGLLNRRQFEALAKRELIRSERSKTPFSILMLDIDDFKKINDTYGHAAGDTVLKKFTQRCADHLRGSDLFARYGGEEFVILLPDTDKNKAEQVAARIRDCIAEEKVISSEDHIAVTTCIGVAVSNAGGDPINEVIDQADQALYEAKAMGINSIASAS